MHRLLFPTDSEWVLGEVQNVMFGGNTTAPLEIIICVNSLTSDYDAATMDAIWNSYEQWGWAGAVN